MPTMLSLIEYKESPIYCDRIHPNCRRNCLTRSYIFGLFFEQRKNILENKLPSTSLQNPTSLLSLEGLPKPIDYNRNFGIF